MRERAREGERERGREKEGERKKERERGREKEGERRYTHAHERATDKERDLRLQSQQASILNSKFSNLKEKRDLRGTKARTLQFEIPKFKI